MNEDMKAFVDYCRQKEINYNIYNYFEDGKHCIKLALSKDKCVHTELYDINKVSQSSVSIWFMFLTLARNINFVYDVVKDDYLYGVVRDNY